MRLYMMELVTSLMGVPIKKPWRIVSWNFDLGGSLSKKCNGNHEHGPCAGRETKETQLYTSIIVGVILRRFRARARCLKPAPLKLALACITRGRSRKHQATASEICTTPTAQPRCWVSPEPLVHTGSWVSPEPQASRRSCFPGSGEYHQDDCQSDCRQHE